MRTGTHCCSACTISFKVVYDVRSESESVFEISLIKHRKWIRLKISLISFDNQKLSIFTEKSYLGLIKSQLELGAANDVFHKFHSFAR